MNAGVEILLKRMDSHPEEFKGLDSHIKSLTPNVNENRWRWIIEAAMGGKFLPDEEKTMLHDKLASIQGEAFTAAVMRELMEDHKRATTGELGMNTYMRAMEAARGIGIGNAGLSQLMGSAPTQILLDERGHEEHLRTYVRLRDEMFDNIHVDVKATDK